MIEELHADVTFKHSKYNILQNNGPNINNNSVESKRPLGICNSPNNWSSPLWYSSQ